MTSLASILTHLRSLANPTTLPGLAKFDVNTEGRLGVRVPELRDLAKQIATMVADPARVTTLQMDSWVSDLNSWDICDGACGNLFVFSPFAWSKVPEWTADEREFVRRAGYVLLACLTIHDKSAPDQAFLDTFPIIKAGASDSRNFVKKAVNWALRGIGKRNLALNKAAAAFSEKLLALDDKTARWVARDALRELQSDKIQARLRQKQRKSRS